MATRFNKEAAARAGYTRSDWDEVSDNPRITKEDMAQAKPFREAFPDLAASIDRVKASRGRPALAVTKQSVTIRLDPDVIAKFKATGKGWQSRVNEVLKQAKL
jgi:uncharacterized protein (DUF4415 family)